MKYIIILALIAMGAYYMYSAYQIIKNFIDKKRKQKKAASKINELLHNALNIDEQANGE